MPSPITKVRKVSVKSPSTSGGDSWDINQSGRDVIGLVVQASNLGATAFNDVFDPIENIFSKISVVGDSETIIELPNGAFIRLGSWLASRYIAGTGKMPYEFLDGTNFDYFLRFIIPIMVKDGQFEDLQVEVDYGDADLSTGAESLGTIKTKVLYGEVTENWYIKSKRHVIASANDTATVTFKPTKGIPLAMVAFVMKDLSQNAYSSVGSNPEIVYPRDWFNDITFSKKGETFYSALDTEEIQELTEQFLDIKYPDVAVAITTATANVRPFMCLPVVDADAATTFLHLQNFMYVLNGLGVVPDTTTSFEVVLSGAAAASRGLTSATLAANDIIDALYISTKYPDGVGKIEEKKL